MSNKGVGAIFCLIASILMGVRYLTAAIFMSGISTWSPELFASGLAYCGPVLLYLAIVAAVIGVCFLVIGIIRDRKAK